MIGQVREQLDDHRGLVGPEGRVHHGLDFGGCSGLVCGRLGVGAVPDLGDAARRAR